MPAIDNYLAALLNAGGSDLLLPSGARPTVRVNGKLYAMGADLLPAVGVMGLAQEMLEVERFRELPRLKNLDFSYELAVGPARRRFRGNMYYQKNGLNIVMRAIAEKVPTLQELGLPPSLLRLTEHHQGLVLVTGPAGSGKTSTLAALIRHLNERKPGHILTIEDPIEYIHESQLSLVNQRQVGVHVESFATALRGALREDPDVILIGEMRDLETTDLAITASETGHLVFSTMHTSSAAQTVDRLIDAFPVDQQPHVRTMLSESLKGVVAQQLIPRADGKGRVAACEVLLVNHGIAHMIREGKTFQIPSYIQTGRKEGMQSMDDSILQLLQDGKITRQDAQERIADPDVARKIGGA